MKNRIALGVVAVVLGAWAIFPDPFPIVIDDILAGLGSAIAILKLVVSFVRKGNAA